MRKLGFRLTHKRTFESNTVYDTSTTELRSSGRVLRLREFGKDTILTFKGPGIEGKHKSREEYETHLTNPQNMQTILRHLGLQPTFRYEKYRTEFRDSHGHLVYDETPIGNYVELEGPPEWIDRTALALGFAESAYITKSYGRLYLEFCQQQGTAPGHMIFS